MNRIAFDANAIWFYTVLAHIAGSVVFTVMGIFPFGSALCLIGLWAACYYITERNRNNRVKILGAAIITLAMLILLPAGYRSSFLMNGLILLIVYYVCVQRRTTVIDYCHIRRITAEQWVMILLMAIAVLIIASYINAVSMLFVQNTVASTLAEAEGHFLESILVYGILPAVVEEAMFRGCIYRGIKRKGIAIVISALTFALLHMNFNQMSYAFVMGLLFAAFFMVTDNLSVPIAVHLLFNCSNVVMSAFWDQPLISWVIRCNIAGYAVFSPSFVNEAGVFQASIFLVGTFITGIVLFLVIGGLYFLEKRNRERNEEKEEVTVIRDWRPDKMFWAGCVACMVIAILYEL